MKGPRGDHAKWDQTERKIPFDIIYMRNLKYDTNGHPYETNRLADTENRTVVAKREQAWGRDGVHGWS